MQAQWVAWVRARPLWAQGAVGVLAALAVVYLLPLILVPEAGLDEAEKRLKAENDLRTTLVQAVGGAIVLLATWRTLHINREGQITERFTRAINQLGETGGEKLDVRLGGIYALERIARDSKLDRGPIVEVLTAFLREHARWNFDNASATDHAATGSGNEHRPRLRADFQAAATVLARNRWAQQHRFDLREVDLRSAELRNAHLERVYLSNAHLEGAILSRAHLEKAILYGAHLEGADLTLAVLEGADLCDAHLETADLSYAHLEGAILRRAHLEGATLYGAQLEGAHLGDAHLEGAYLGDAHLEGAYLADAHLEGAILADAHLESAYLGDAHLEGARLGGAHLERADLTGAHLERADLRGADLDGADFNGAHLEGVEGLTPAQVERVIGLNEATGVPPGLLRT